ncbi:CbtB domain-containing protein [Pseudobacteriovorax antillogorgiicola]|uniref:Cobalt transporter subunit CbtB n=1 Tax=Pseudobacteriovorax antillogorgiicola TaxID=1513793 RepID=A0A1Y6CL38_9BACT|nr:CbtB domain-containing protein [Pseudobacteriovorax antillogorgiicola]TCS45697.1 cobalt transporter subunit CbtB [Pseudobacteriovorax antillogorgiicola]SMF73357.1 cobalt transporter subunit CbtB [Pseudobacteriovorax antillogorgiicola]
MARVVSTQSQSVSTQVLLATICFAMGLAIMLAVGFSAPIEAHNAAHDTRHAAAFPCH